MLRPIRVVRRLMGVLKDIRRISEIDQMSIDICPSDVI